MPVVGLILISDSIIINFEEKIHTKIKINRYSRKKSSFASFVISAHLVVRE